MCMYVCKRKGDDDGLLFVVSIKHALLCVAYLLIHYTHTHHQSHLSVNMLMLFQKNFFYFFSSVVDVSVNITHVGA